MRCNSLLNNYCYIIISWLPVLALGNGNNSWNECIGNDNVLFEKRHFQIPWWLFTGGFVWRFSPPPPLFGPSFPRFLVAPSWCRAVGSPKRSQVEFYHRFGFTCTFFILVILVKRSKLVPQHSHSPIMGGAIHHTNKMATRTKGKCPWACCALCLDCSWEGVPLGCPVCNYMFHHLSVSNHKLWSLFYGCVEWVSHDKLRGLIAL